MSRMKNLIGVVCAILIFSVTTSYASLISMSPSAEDVFVGDQVLLEIYMDFSDDPTLGGGIDISYNSSLLSYVSFVFDSGFEDDSDLRRMPDVLPDENLLDGLAFGHVNGISGPSLLGILTFNALDSGFGLATVTLSMDENETNAGGFYSAVHPYQAQDVTFEGATVNIAPVPEPATIVLFLCGSGFLGFLRKNNSK